MPNLHLPQKLYDKLTQSAEAQKLSTEDHIASLLSSDNLGFQKLHEQKVNFRTQELAAVNKQLSESERRYRAISELSMDYAYAYHRNGDTFELEWATDAFASITALCEDNIRTLEELSKYIHPSDLDNFTIHINLLVTMEVVLQFECRIVVGDGSMRTMMMRYRSEGDENSGLITRVIGVVQDISTQKDIEEALMQERNLQQKLVETTPTGIILFNKDGFVTFANQRVTEIVELPLEDILQHTPESPQWEMQDLEGQLLPDSHTPFELIMTSGKTIHDLRHRVKLKSNKTIYISINGAPLIDSQGDIQQIIFNIDDITQSFLLERTQQEQIRHEQELLALKSNFVTLVSHELRTPMALILTSAQIVEQQAHSISPETLLNRMAKITKQVMRLRRIMADVSFINRLDEVGHQLQLQEIDLHFFCQEFIDDTITVTSTTVSVVLATETDETMIVTDKTLLEQIFGNLLTNALKYTLEDGQVFVTCGIGEETYFIEVADTGIGIPEGETQKLFDNFFRASNVENIIGTGLGLGILKRAVTELKGAIEWESEENKGTRFRITLPMSLDS